jgi:sRNA-binding protein
MCDLLEDTLAILAAAGIKPEVQQGRHLKVRWHDAAGRRRLLIISRSPSNRFAHLRNFTQKHLKRPLKKNILLDLEHDGVLDDDRREAAVSYYTQGWDYEAVLQAGAKRVDLDGKEVGTVTETEAREARERVAAQKKERAEKKQVLIHAVRERAVIEKGMSLPDGKIPTDIPLMRPPSMAKPKTSTNTPLPAPEPPPAVNGADLTQLRALWGNIDAVLTTAEGDALRSALAVAALKVFVGEAAKVIASLEGSTT